MSIKNDTKTFLGFIDEPIDSLKINKEEEEEDDYPYSTKIGGSPIWCAQPPNHLKDLKCNMCSSNLSFLLQAYCPLNSLPDYERNFYVFVCPSNECNPLSSGWRVIKCLDPLKEEEEDLQNEQIEDKVQELHQQNVIEKPLDDWGVEDSDDWGISSTTTTTTTTTASVTNSIDQLLKIRDDAIKEEKKRIKEEEQQKKNNNKINIEDDCINEEEIISGVIIPDDKSNKFQSCTLFIDEESIYTKKDKKSSNKNNNNNEESDLNQSILKKYQGIENTFGDESAEWSDETYEYVKDRVFSKFIKKISFAPDQCLRYSYGGKPLPMTAEGVKLLTFNQINNLPPHCSICNSVKVFEFQILSTLIAQIKLRDPLDPKKNQLEFSNAFIYTCPNNCFDKQKDTFNNVIYNEETIKIEKSI
ncbi:hypothetical protein DDB_G0284887 [Dictyostelium discoideum AX4]|uniref:Programmed cell death protein 2 C-terminal domain-containing protein n=1 Tax=Dictyostelium discoideum TaxID=44689 RepID=Q54P06_DICDI|nr:hypothetical protein DDB_G0284887 [Dictyostelium discoideum AX4]EAL64907.1 hypothetical protein DDB_G0284887 [Dictyostelium discoideum AX4]|eukprot:XP_639911.1 hypothetical protein DDB_G0284887 [Dictyostelium discoideum AX4]